MLTPTFDADGYPTEEFLDQIKNYYQFCKDQGLSTDNIKVEVLEALQEAWYYPDMAICPRPGIYTFATGGWSGNEALMGAFRRSVVYAVIGWKGIELSGGLSCYAITEEAQKEMHELHEYIIEWAWRKEIEVEEDERN